VTTFHAKTQSYKPRRKEDFQSLRLRSLFCAFARNLFIVLLFVRVIGADGSVPARVTITVTPADVKIEAELSAPARSWSFRNTYAGALGFAERVKDFQSTGASGQDTGAKKIASGEFRSEHDATKITYTVDLSATSAADVPHISWLTAGRGFLLFADLIPRDIERLAAEFKLPSGWTIESSLPPDKEGRYEVLEPETAVFMVGNSLRKTSNTNLELVVNGTWPFKDNKAFDAATQVMKQYTTLTGFNLPGTSLIAVAPFSLGGSKWKAETRGTTVILLIDPDAHFDTWIGQLKVIFTHEMLHLWVPNSLQLDGDYDWFFEGFTLYTALRTALELKVINFKGFLETLAGAYDVYISYPDDVSLIQASETRWTSGFNQVYVKGMLVAFLYDLKIRKGSGGKALLADRYRQLFDGRVAANANGNEVIIALLDAGPAMSGFGKLYVENNTKLELEQLLSTYGLTLDASGKKSQLQVSRNLSAEQKQLLRSLGYRD
jgi:predicted metalloprotease with PDZ domain